MSLPPRITPPLRRVLHVLPHAGAGARTYLDVLASIDGYEFEIFELSASRSPIPAAASIAGHMPKLARAALRSDLIHVHGEVASLSSLPLLVSRPSVVTLHGLHLLRRLRPGTPAKLGCQGLRLIVGAADRTICVSQAEFDDLDFLPLHLGSKLVVVRNGLAAVPPADPGFRARARASLELAGDTLAVLYLGQLEPRKDPLTLVRAVQRVHAKDDRTVLLIAGDGPSAAELRALGGPELRLLGHRADVPDLLAAADIFVMPSLREGLSYAVLEALASGVPTIVSDGRGNPEAVGDAGLVFPAGDDIRLAELILELSDPARRAVLSAAGRARTASELSVDKMLRDTRAVYESVAKGPVRGAAARLA